MKTIFALTLKAATRNPFLLFWSILLPVGGTVGLGLYVGKTGYPLRITTGMMAVGVLFYAFTTTVFTVLGQRRRGVYNLLRVTPLPMWRYLCALSASWTLVSLLSALLTLTAGVVAFRLKVSMLSVLMAALVTLPAALGYVLLSVFASSYCRTEANASMLSNLTTMPLLFLSDAFYSLKASPSWLKVIAQFNPFQWFVDGLRSSLSLEAGTWLIRTGLLVALLLIALPLAVRTFRFADA